jgi:hypothetical protein
MRVYSPLHALGDISTPLHALGDISSRVYEKVESLPFTYTASIESRNLNSSCQAGLLLLLLLSLLSQLSLLLLLLLLQSEAGVSSATKV